MNADACNAARKRIEDITADVEVGRIYEGTVLRLLDFGAIVQILPGRDGLLHISQIAKERVNNVSDYLKEGQMVRVKVLEADEKGRVRLSMKAITEDTLDRHLIFARTVSVAIEGNASFCRGLLAARYGIPVPKEEASV